MSGWGQAHINNTIGFGGGVSCGGFTGLLDDYPGAAAAYSLRLLRSDYSGGLVRVMAWNGLASQGEADIMPYKVGDDYVVDLNSTLENLDAIAIVRGLTTSDTLADLVLTGTSNYDGLVPAWYDQSINGNNATQTSAAAMPKLVSSGVLITKYGKAAIEADGITNEFEFNSFATNGFYLGVVGENTSAGTIISGGNDVNNRFDYGPRVVNSYRLLTRNLGNGTTIDSGINTVGSYLFSATKNSSTNGEIYLNGTSQQSGVDVRDLLAYTNTNRLFSRYAISTFADFISGQWNEVVIYPTDQSSNRAAIETNINNFYSIYP